MKHAIGAVYTNFESQIIDAGNMEQTEGFTNGPKSDKVRVSFRKLEQTN